MSFNVSGRFYIKNKHVNQSDVIKMIKKSKKYGKFTKKNYKYIFVQDNLCKPSNTAINLSKYAEIVYFNSFLQSINIKPKNIICRDGKCFIVSKETAKAEQQENIKNTSQSFDYYIQRSESNSKIIDLYIQRLETIRKRIDTVTLSIINESTK